MRRESFSLSGPLLFDVATSSGDVEIVPGNPGEVIVELRGGPAADYIVELQGSDLTVRPPSKPSGKRRHASTDIKLHVPNDTAGNVRTASGDVLVVSRVRSLVLATASGDCRVQDSVTEDFEAKTASGDVKLRDVGANLAVTTASGDVLAENVGADFRFNSTSGGARIAAVAGAIEVKTVSGNLSVRAAAGPSVRIRSLSGDARLGIPAGRTVDLDMQTMSGEVTNRIKKSGEASVARRSLTISMKSVSGSLRLDNA
ncbi:DUF4097 domain-containing protein [Actinomycetota bacterium]